MAVADDLNVNVRQRGPFQRYHRAIVVMTWNPAFNCDAGEFLSDV